MKLPIRLRMTLWYSIILAGCLIAFSIVVYTQVRSELAESIEDDLEERAALLLTLIQTDSSGRMHLDVLTKDKKLEDTFQRLLDTAGNVLYDNSDIYGNADLDLAALAAAEAQGDHLGNVRSDDDDGTALLTVPVRKDGSIVGYLQVGEARDEFVEAMTELRSVFMTAIPLALLLTGVGGYWLSTRALRPVNEVTQMAREIAAGDLSRRLRLDLPNDEIGRLARTFDEMIERLEQMVSRQRQFTADASHELRTPLAAIKGQVEVALSQPRDLTTYQGVLRLVDLQMERMTRLVEAMLLLARSDSGSMVPDQEWVDVGQVVESVRELAAPLAAEKGLTLSVERGPATAVFGDEGLLIQALLNLAENAVRYTSTGAVRIGWTRSGDETRIYVRDTGPGIASEHQAKIFEPFYRVDASRSNARGAGLGLSICRWIVQAHGGRIEVASNERGSVFTITLAATPYARAQAGEPATSRAPHPVS